MKALIVEKILEVLYEAWGKTYSIFIEGFL